MGNAAGSLEVSQGKEGKMSGPGSTGPQKPMAGVKLPMPPEEELEERFSAVLVSQEVHDCAASRKKWNNRKTKNVEYVGNVHVLRTSLSLCQVHNATEERYIRAPLYSGLLQL